MVRSNLGRFQKLLQGFSMIETLTITNERGDDIPLLLGQLDRAGL